MFYDTLNVIVKHVTNNICAYHKFKLALTGLVFFAVTAMNRHPPDAVTCLTARFTVFTATQQVQFFSQEKRHTQKE